MDLDVEIRTGDAKDALTEQPRFASPRQHGLELFEQIAVLAAQIEKTAPGTDRHRRHRHALEDEIGMTVEQHAILEGARLALIGIADDDAAAPCRHRRIAAGIPFQRCREAGTATAAQAGAPQFVDHYGRPGQALRQSFTPRAGIRGIEPRGLDAVTDGLQGIARLQPGIEQHVAATDVVGHDEQFGRPVCQRHLAPDEFAELVDARLVKIGNDAVVDQQRRSLIPHADTRRGAYADQPVLGDLAGLDPETAAHAFHQRRTALHALDDVVGEEHAIAALRACVEETVETGDALDLRARQSEYLRQLIDRRRRNPFEHFLHLAQYLQQGRRIATPLVQYRRQGGGDTRRPGFPIVVSAPVHEQPSASLNASRRPQTSPMPAPCSDLDQVPLMCTCINFTENHIFLTGR